MEKKFVKNLTEEEKNNIIKFIFMKFDLNDTKKSIEFYNSILNYVSNVRREIETFKINITEVIETFTLCGYSNDDIISILTKEPSLLHEDKNNIFWKLLLFGKVYNPKTGRNLRFDDVINNPAIFRFSTSLIYARIKYLESEKGKLFRRKNDLLTKRQITKTTNKEFYSSYGIDKEDLLNLYPFDNQAQIDVISWQENKEFLESISMYHKRV